MTSDIVIKDLAAVGREDAEYLVSLITTTPDFPKEGIHFRDCMPVFADPRGFRILVDAMAETLPVPADEFDAVAGLEARGFLYAAALATRLGKGCVAVRKAGKLPPETYAVEYGLEYGTAKAEIEKDALKPGERVILVDDLIATGGSAKAATELIAKAGGKVVGYSFMMGLEGLDGVSRLGDAPVTTLVTMPA